MTTKVTTQNHGPDEIIVSVMTDNQEITRTEHVPVGGFTAFCVQRRQALRVDEVRNNTGTA